MLNESQVATSAQALLAARASNSVLDITQHPVTPSTLDDSYAIQALVAAGTGVVSGWKVGAPSADGLATFAPLAAAGVHPSGTTLDDGGWRMRGIEVEVAYRLANDLPTRSGSYSAQDVAQAVDAVVPIIEVVETRLSDRNAAEGMWALADNLSHGELIVGEPITAQWQEIALQPVAVMLRFNDDVIIDRLCHNAGGHPFDMVVRLANLCGDHCGGLRAGQIITTGSLMGVEMASVGASVSASVDGVGAVSVRFAA